MTDSKLCAGCLRGEENKKGESWCSDCGELVCRTCANFHKKLSPPHQIVPVEKISNLSSSLLYLSKNCETHTNQRIVLFCCQHDHPICDNCTSEFHQNYKPVISIEKAAKDAKESTAITDLEMRMDNLCQIMEKVIGEFTQKLVDLKRDKSEIRKKITETKRDILAQLDKMESSVIGELDTKYKQCTGKLKTKKDNLKSRYDLLTTWRNDLKLLKTHSSNTHLFQAIKYLDVKTHDGETEIRNINKNNDGIQKLTFQSSDDVDKLPDVLLLFGSLLLEENSLTSAASLDIDQQGQIFVRTEEKQMSLITSFSTSVLGEGIEIKRGCFCPGNKLLLLCYNTNVAYVCNRDGSGSTTITLEDNLCTVTMYDKDAVIVALCDTGIQMIDLRTYKPGRVIKVSGDCDGITSVDGKIWVSNEVKTLTMIDIHGKVIKTIDTSFDPKDICMNKAGDIYCTDINSNDVYVVRSGRGERVVYSSPDLVYSTGITVDNRGDVYIAGCISHNIHRLSSDGRRTGIILTEDDGIRYPQGLSYNNETNELMVINDGGDSVNNYKIK